MKLKNKKANNLGNKEEIKYQKENLKLNSSHIFSKN